MAEATVHRRNVKKSKIKTVQSLPKEANRSDNEISEKYGTINNVNMVDHLKLCDNSESTSSFPQTTDFHEKLKDTGENFRLNKNMVEPTLVHNLECTSIVGTVEKTNIQCNDSIVSKQIENHLEMPNEFSVRNTKPQVTKLIAEDATIKSSGDIIATAPIQQCNVHILSEKQLQDFYFNEVLESANCSANEFMQQANPTRHELLDLLNAYTRSRQRLQLSQTTLDAKYKAILLHSENTWFIEKKSGVAHGRCQDNIAVSGSYDFEVATYDEASRTNLKNALRDLREELSEEMALQAYTVLITRLQVEVYLHDLLSTNPLLQNVNSVDPIRINSPNGGLNVQIQLHRLREALSVLFYFFRKPTFVHDTEVRHDLKMWAERLAAVLLRVGHVFDHLFLMHHLLRCPPGLSAEWASLLLQFSLQPPDLQTLKTSCGGSDCRFQNVELDYMVTCLALLLRPVIQRETFLMALRQLSTPLSSSDKVAEEDLDRKWILIDSEGEEDEDPEESWHRFQENDLMALLNQFPLDVLFQRILCIAVDNGASYYDPSMTSFSGMMRLLAFGHCLLNLLTDGLKHFNLGRYRQLNKRLGRLIRMLSQFMTDHWLNVRTSLMRSECNAKDVMQLQIQYEAFMQSICVALLGANRLGSWQYLVNIPFELLGSRCKYHVARLLFVDGSAAASESDSHCTMSSVEICSTDFQVLEARLPSMAPAESIYLLSTAAALARACKLCCDSSTLSATNEDDTALLNLLVVLLFRLSYVCEETRDTCAKVGRELLSGVAFRHPRVLNTLLALVAQEIDNAGSMVLYLFRDLPLHLMIPGEIELRLLEQWLLNSSVASVPHQLSRIILNGLNWENDLEPEADLSYTTHHRVALLLAASSQQLLKQNDVALLLSPPRSLVPGWFSVGATPEQQAWQCLVAIALRLRLHQSRWNANWVPEEVSMDPRQVDLAGRLDHRHIVEGAAQKNPLASYFVLCLSRVGHVFELFTTQGIALLQSMLEWKGGAPLALEALTQCLPLFGTFQQQQYLLTDTFSALMSSILKADVNTKDLSKSPTGIAKSAIDKNEECSSWFSTCMGAVLASIEVPVYCSTFVVNPVADSMLAFWLRLFTRSAAWHTDALLVQIIDELLEYDFRHHNCGGQLGLQVLSAAHLAHVGNSNANSNASASRTLFGIMNWLANGNNFSSLLDGLPSGLLVHNNSLGWLRWQICRAEALWEDKCGLWFDLLKRLIMEPSLDAEQAIRGVANTLKLRQMPNLTQLSVVRSIHQAVLLPVTHAALPVLCQLFFRRFLGRALGHKDSQVVGGVGERFFSAALQRASLKNFRSHLREASLFWRKRFDDVRADQLQALDDEGEVISHNSSNAAVDAVRESCCMTLSSAFEAFALWCDEPRLHHAGLHLISLPMEYQPARLMSLMENSDDALWLDLVRTVHDADVTSRPKSHLHHHRHVLLWMQRHRLEKSLQQLGNLQTQQENESAAHRLLERLTRLSSEKKRLAAPQVMPLQSPLMEVDAAALVDFRLLQNALHESITMMTEFARNFSDRTSRFAALDFDYTESLLPQLFLNQTTRTTLSLACPTALQMSAMRPLRRCKGEAVVTVEYQALRRNDAIHARLSENRNETNHLLLSGRMFPPLSLICAIVRVERAITSLVRGSHQHQASFTSSGAELFFNLVNLINVHTRLYPPTRNFLGSAIDVLGQTFIQSNASQYAIRILEAVFAEPDRVDLLAPNFNPASAAPSDLLQLYRRLVAAAADGTDGGRTSENAAVLFSLFSKFDLSSWLRPEFGTTPADADCHALIDVIGEALVHCGLEPHNESLLLFELHRRHMRTLLQFNFPTNLFEVLRCFMKFSSNQQLASSCWSDVVTIVTADDLDMTTERLSTIIFWFSSELWKNRLHSVADREAFHFGLYPRWRRYLPDVVRLGARLLLALANKTMRSVINGHQSLSIGVNFLWKAVVEIFGPWLATALQVDAGTSGGVAGVATGRPLLTQPWILENGADASIVLAEFVDFLKHVEDIWHELNQKGGSLFLPLLWQWYQMSLAPVDCNPVSLLLLHKHLEKFVWQALRPDPHLLASMLQFYAVCAPASRSFLASVFAQVAWASWLNDCGEDNLVSLVPQMFHAIIAMCANAELLSRHDVLQLMTTLACHNCWRHLTLQQYESSTQWLSTYCEPREMLFERSSSQHHVLRFLQTAVGLETCGDAADDNQCQLLQDLAMSKQVSFIRFNVQMLCRATGGESANTVPKALEIETHLIHMPVVNMLTDIEAALQKVFNTERRNIHGMTLAQESLNLLRNCTPARLRLFLDTFAGWCRDSGGSPLLLPLMRSVLSQPPNLQVCSVLTESILQAYLNEDGRGGWDSWTCVLVAMDISNTQTGSFANAMLEADALRSLHLLLLKELQRCRSADDEAAVAGRAADWLLRSKVRAVDAEVGFVLLLDKTLELITRLAESNTTSGGYGGALRFLTDFIIPALEPLAADKVSGGVLGLIGLGKSSSLSVRFRLICRSILGYLHSQTPSNGTLRILPNAPGYLTTVKLSSSGFVAPNNKAEQILNQLVKLKSNSQYAQHSSLLDFVCAFMCDPQRCLSSSRILIGTLCSQLYTNERSLTVLVSSAQIQ